MSMVIAIPQTYEETIDFIALGSTPEQIISALVKRAYNINKSKVKNEFLADSDYRLQKKIIL